MYNIDSSWEHSADLSSIKCSKFKHKDLRWNPGVYTDPRTGEKHYCDVWTRQFLETNTPFDNYEDLFKHIKFSFEGDENK